MLENIVAGLAHHDATCPMAPRAVLLNPADHAEFDWDEIKGIPVESSDAVTPKRFRIDCSGSAHGVEEAVEQFVVEPVELPVEAPATPVPAITPGRSPFGGDAFDDVPLDPYRW